MVSGPMVTRVMSPCDAARLLRRYSTPSMSFRYSSSSIPARSCMGTVSTSASATSGCPIPAYTGMSVLPMSCRSLTAICALAAVFRNTVVIPITSSSSDLRARQIARASSASSPISVSMIILILSIFFSFFITVHTAPILYNRFIPSYPMY